MDTEAAALMGLPGLVADGAALSAAAKDFIAGDYFKVLDSARARRVWADAGLDGALDESCGVFMPESTVLREREREGGREGEREREEKKLFAASWRFPFSLSLCRSLRPPLLCCALTSQEGRPRVGDVSLHY